MVQSENMQVLRTRSRLAEEPAKAAKSPMASPAEHNATVFNEFRDRANPCLRYRPSAWVATIAYQSGSGFTNLSTTVGGELSTIAARIGDLVAFHGRVEASQVPDLLSALELGREIAPTLLPVELPNGGPLLLSGANSALFHFEEPLLGKVAVSLAFPNAPSPGDSAHTLHGRGTPIAEIVPRRRWESCERRARITTPPRLSLSALAAEIGVEPSFGYGVVSTVRLVCPFYVSASVTRNGADSVTLTVRTPWEDDEELHVSLIPESVQAGPGVVVPGREDGWVRESEPPFRSLTRTLEPPERGCLSVPARSIWVSLLSERKQLQGPICLQSSPICQMRSP